MIRLQCTVRSLRAAVAIVALEFVLFRMACGRGILSAPDPSSNPPTYGWGELALNMVALNFAMFYFFKVMHVMIPPPAGWPPTHENDGPAPPG